MELIIGAGCLWIAMITSEEWQERIKRKKPLEPKPEPGPEYWSNDAGVVYRYMRSKS